MSKETILCYINELVNSIPDYIYESLISILCLWVTFTIAINGFTSKGIRYILKLLFFEYIVLLLCSTVVFRKAVQNRLYNVKPFNSYNRIIDGNDMLIPEVLMNVVVFIPVGFLLGTIYYKTAKWLTLLLIGLGLSLAIEISQYIFKRGFSDIDDVILNIIGCLIGLIIPYVCFFVKKALKIRTL